jgi:2-polyprenyl-3-methyl-5-hydroxy-6-metoxy-1,4-benzoquinol methylase
MSMSSLIVSTVSPSGRQLGRHDVDSSGTHKPAIARHYDEDVSYWRDVYVSPWDSFGSYEVVHRKDIVLGLVEQCASSGSKSADIGCGSGALMLDLLKLGHHVTGLDISEKMVQAARQAADTQFPGQSVCVVGDVEDLPFENGSFDCVTCVGVLSHQPDPGRMVAELSRIVRDDGCVIVTVVNLVRLQHVLDPHTLVTVGSRLIHGLLRSGRGKRPGIRQEVRGGSFMLRRYHYRELEGIFDGSGLAIRTILPCTFGPLRFWGREVLPRPISERLSRRLEALAVRRGFGSIRLFANSWVICLDKAGYPTRTRASGDPDAARPFGRDGAS